MEVKSCRGCGKLFNSLGISTPVCPSCMKKLEERFEKVKDYIYKNPKADIQSVSNDTETSIRQIKQWVREERLSFSEDSPIGIECENCGANILTGRFCNSCKSKLTNNLSESIRKPKQPPKKEQKKDPAKMRFLD